VQRTARSPLYRQTELQHHWARISDGLYNRLKSWSQVMDSMISRPARNNILGALTWSLLRDLHQWSHLTTFNSKRQWIGPFPSLAFSIISSTLCLRTCEHTNKDISIQSTSTKRESRPVCQALSAVKQRSICGLQRADPHVLKKRQRSNRFQIWSAKFIAKTKTPKTVQMSSVHGFQPLIPVWSA